MIEKPEAKEGIISKYHTKYLFVETCPKDALDPKYTKFTLKDKDRVIDDIKYLSLKKLYLEEEDLSEYIFAEKYLDNYEHWEELVNSSFFENHIREWRRLLVIKIKAKALKLIIEESLLEGKNSFAASKYLLDTDWTIGDGSVHQKGKVRKKTYVSKTEVKEEARKLLNPTFEQDKLQEAERLMNNFSKQDTDVSFKN